MSVLDDKIAFVANDISEQGLPVGVVGQSDFLDFLKEIFKELLPLIIGCFPSTQKAVAVANDPNWFQQFRLRRFIRQQMIEHPLAQPLERSMLKVGKTLTVAELEAMLNDI